MMFQISFSSLRPYERHALLITLRTNFVQVSVLASEHLQLTETNGAVLYTMRG